MRKTLQTFWRQKTFWLMVTPAIIYFVVFSYLPMIGAYYAFVDYDFSAGLFGSRFVGFQNFRFLFAGGADAIIWRLTKNTLFYNILFIGFGTFLQIVIALFIYEMPWKRYAKVCQSLMILPHFISYVLVSVLVYSFLSYDVGAINSLLSKLGGSKINIYTTPSVWPPLLVFIQIWKGTGYGTVVYLAALVGIDKSIFEAAELDGATRFQRVRFITLPSIRPTIVILLLFSLGGIIRGQFDMFYQLIGKNGLLYETCDIIDTYVYRSLMVNFDMGLSTAAGLYQSLIGLIMVVGVNMIVKKIEPDYALF